MGSIREPKRQPSRRGGPSVISACAFAALSLCPLDALADGAINVALDYDRGPGAEACPDVSGFESIVRARVGHDPFVAPASVRARVRIVRKDGELIGTLEVDGSRARAIRSASRDCDEIVASIALALAIRIDPSSLAPMPAPPIEQAPPAAPEQKAREAGADITPAPAPSTPSPTPQSFTLRSSIGALAAIGSGPQLTGGATLQLGVRSRDVSVGLEGRVDLPTDEGAASGGRVRAGLLAGTLLPCLHHQVLLGCMLATVGVLRASGESVLESKSESIPVVAVGARLGVELPISGPFLVRFHLDGLAPLIRPTLRLDASPVWRAPAFSGALGAALAAVF